MTEQVNLLPGSSTKKQPPQAKSEIISNICVKLLKLWELKHNVIYVIMAVHTPFTSSIAMFLNVSL